METVYGKCPYVLQSYVYGDSLKSYLVAVVVPNLENLIPWARQNGINVRIGDDSLFNLAHKLCLGH